MFHVCLAAVLLTVHGIQVHHYIPDASYDGGISSSSDDGVLLGRALRDELLLLERDFAGGFKADGAGAGGGAPEHRSHK